MSGSTANDGAWKSKEMSEEARYAREKEASQLAALRDVLKSKEATIKTEGTAQNAADSDSKKSADPDFEGGYGGQEDLEDRYATTYGAH